MIKPLPPEIVAKIAAGEVVERPASIVKELLENSLDAGSRTVKVEIGGGGRTLIRVIDDGEGMTPQDALLAVKRYTTSKIASLEDLFAIQTFGFRGEALSSIAAVSRMKLTTRKDGSLSGIEIRIEGGAPASSAEAGCPPGTAVEVRDLFFNVPARLKFLKASGTELGHIGDAVARTALAHPSVQFQLFHEGKLLAHYPVRKDPLSRVAEALGKEAGGRMFFFESRNGGTDVSGYAGDPDFNRPNARGIYLFVNRRPVRDRMLSHAVIESYRNLIPRERYPVALLFVEVAPSEVDVNVHPSKWEVKFSDSERVHRRVIGAVRGMLESTPWLRGRSRESGLRETLRAYPFQDEKIPFPFSSSMPFKAAVDQPETLPGEAAAYLGQIHQTYLLFSGPEGLILIDQHAAHERVVLEKLFSEFSGGEIAREPLLIPIGLELPADEAKILEEHLGDLHKVGFEMEPSGPKTFWVKSTPRILSDSEPITILRDMIADVSSWGPEATLRGSFDSLLKMMACRGAIQASRILRREEAQALLADLLKCAAPSHCPHGRPTLLKITRGDLEKMFGRK